MVGDIYELRMHWSQEGKNAVNRLWAREDVRTLAPIPAKALADAWYEAFFPVYADLCSQDVQLTGVSASRILPNQGVPWRNIGTVPGLNILDAAPPQAPIVLRLYAAHENGNARGWIHLPGCPSFHTELGQITGNWHQQLVEALTPPFTSVIFGAAPTGGQWRLAYRPAFSIDYFSVNVVRIMPNLGVNQRRRPSIGFGTEI